MGFVKGDYSIISERNVTLDVYQYIVTIYPEDQKGHQRKPKDPLVRVFHNSITNIRLKNSKAKNRNLKLTKTFSKIRIPGTCSEK